VLTFEQIKELIELVARHQLSGIELDRSGFRLKIDGLHPAPPQGAAGVTPQGLQAYQGFGPLPLAAGATPAGAAPPLAALSPPAQQPQAAPPAPSQTSPAAPAPAAAGAPSGKPAAAANAHILTSPIVGTFYRSPSPEAPPFVEVGSRVNKGMMLCIIEAMKLMNEIECDVSGVVVEVFPQNAQAVEFGEPLFAIDTNR
jgi:acetyl-CoA carboxylase biotin carboxyl carrier protein